MAFYTMSIECGDLVTFIRVDGDAEELLKRAFWAVHREFFGEDNSDKKVED